nr:MFS transporter [Citricoccus sp. K5]
MALAISGIGIGKLIGPVVAGFLSDRLGRRPMIMTSLAMNVVFFVGMAFSTNYVIGFILSLWFGIANAFLDSGAYPALMESFPRKAGSANLLVKAAIAIGQLLLPILVAGGLFWQTSFYGAAALLALILVAMFFVKFPDREQAPQKSEGQSPAPAGSVPGAKLSVEGVALVIFGFTSTGAFWLAQQSLPGMGQNLAGMSSSEASRLVSVYAIGSLLGVFVNAALVARWVRPTTLLIINPIMTTIAYVLLLTSENPVLYSISAFMVGYFAAGGLFQLTVVVLAEFFPANKGVVTSAIGFASGLAAFVLPFLTSVILGDATGEALRGPYQTVVWLGIVVSVASALLGLLVRFRHRAVFSAPVATAAEVTAGR